MDTCMQNDRNFEKKALKFLWECGDDRLLKLLDQYVCGPLPEIDLGIGLMGLVNDEICRLEEQRKNDRNCGEPEDARDAS